MTNICDRFYAKVIQQLPHLWQELLIMAVKIKYSLNGLGIARI